MDIEIKIDPAIKDIKLLIMAPAMSDKVTALKDLLEQSDTDFIYGCKDNNIQPLEPSSIIRIYSSNQRVYAVCQSGEYIIKKRMYQIEELLEDIGFIRISNSEIINIKKVKAFDLSLAGTICVRFKDNSSTYVSRRYIKRIKQAINI